MAITAKTVKELETITCKYIRPGQQKEFIEDVLRFVEIAVAEAADYIINGPERPS